MPILFTPTELQTIHNRRFFFIKTNATNKVKILFAEVRDEIKTIIKQKHLIFPEEVDVDTGKIFRGENYLGFPYLVLDYPKCFSKESVFAFRTMFWWGNFFSFTLHLQGKALEERRKALFENISTLKKKNIYICINDNPWQYHYKKDNYILIDKLSDSEIKNIFFEKEFVKLSRKISLKNYKKARSFARESFLLLLPRLLFKSV